MLKHKTLLLTTRVHYAMYILQGHRAYEKITMMNTGKLRCSHFFWSLAQQLLDARHPSKSEHLVRMVKAFLHSQHILGYPHRRKSAS